MKRIKNQSVIETGFGVDIVINHKTEVVNVSNLETGEEMIYQGLQKKPNRILTTRQ